MAENQERLHALGEPVTSPSFDGRAAESCGEIGSDLARQGRQIGPYDAQMTTIARTADPCAVTRNLSEFGRVPY